MNSATRLPFIPHHWIFLNVLMSLSIFIVVPCFIYFQQPPISSKYNEYIPKDSSAHYLGVKCTHNFFRGQSMLNLFSSRCVDFSHPFLWENRVRLFFSPLLQAFSLPGFAAHQRSFLAWKRKIYSYRWILTTTFTMCWKYKIMLAGFIPQKHSDARDKFLVCYSTLAIVFRHRSPWLFFIPYLNSSLLVCLLRGTANFRPLD